MAAAIVRSIHDLALREINALEQRIVGSEDETDAQLWEQARLVVEQLDAGLSQRQLAAQWINSRTGEPYSYTHVQIVAKVFRDKFTCQSRPRFRDTYNALANATPPGGGQANVAAAQEVFAKRQKLGDDVIGFAFTIKIRALARLGELLTQVEKATGTRGQKLRRITGGAIAEPPEKTAPTLADLGIDKKTSFVAQQLAALPRKMREAKEISGRPCRAKRCSMRDRIAWRFVGDLPPSAWCW